MEDEQVNGGKESLGKSNLLGKHTTIIMTGEESVRSSTQDSKIEIEGSGLSELGSSHLGSFQSLYSSQSSERDKMISLVPLLEEVKV